MLTKEQQARLAELQSKYPEQSSVKSVAGSSGLTPAQASRYEELKNKYAKFLTPDVSQLESIRRGAYQGATLGFGDEINALAERGMDAVSGIFGDSYTDVNKQLAEQGFKGDVGPTSGKELYRQARDEDRDRNYYAQKANPWSYGASNVVGSFAPMLIPGVSVAKGASVVNAALKSGGLGAIMGLGSTEELDVQGAKDVAKGAALGGLFGAVGQGISNKINKATPESLSRDAEILSAQAQGLERGSRKRLSKGDILEEKKVRNIGRQGLDEDIVTLGASAKDMAERNAALKKSAMDTRGASYNKIDELRASEFNPLEAAIKVEEKILGGLNRAYDDTKKLIQSLDPELSNIMSRGDKNISMDEAQKLVSSLGKKAKFDKTRSNEASDLATNVYHAVRDYINDSAEKAGGKINIQGLKESIVKANKQYSVAKDADSIIANKVAREANKKFSLTDWIALSSANPFIYFPKKILEEYGDKGMAIGLDKAAKMLARNPKTLGKFKDGLEIAARKSPQAFNAKHTRLMNESPEYRLKMRKRIELDPIDITN